MQHKILRIVLVLLLTLACDSQSQPAGGYVLLYDGIDDYVTVADHPSLDITSAITIEAWVKKRANVQWASIVTKGTGRGGPDFTPNNYTLHEDSLGGFIFTTDAGILAQSSIRVPLNEWHHVAMTWDGVLIKFYFDGILDIAAITPFSGTLLSNDSLLVIGADFPGEDEYYAGYLDEVRVWNMARTETEIRANMSKRLVGNELGLAAYWHLDEGSGTIARDLTHNGNRGNLIGFNFNSTSGWVARESTRDRVVRLMDTIAVIGGTVSIPIELIALGNENALGFSLSFDTSILSNPQAMRGSDAGSAVLNPNCNQCNLGRFGINLALPAGQTFAAGTRQIVVVTFAVSASTNADMTIINFEDQPIAREVIDPNVNILSAVWFSGKIAITRGCEGDVFPRPYGDIRITLADWVQIGRFSAGLDLPRTDTNEFQRADCSPKPCGDGRLSIADWVQAGRYAAGLDPKIPACGPTSPGSSTPLVANAMDADLETKSQLSGARIVRVVNATFHRGQLDSLAVELDAQGDENALGFSLNFDPTLLPYRAVKLGSGANGASLIVNESQAANGRLGIAVALPAGQAFAPGTKQLVHVFFIPIGSGPAVTTSVSFGDQPIAREIVDTSANLLSATWVAGTITILPPNAVNGGANSAPVSFVLEQNHPNPFNPATTIGFTLPHSGHVTLKIYDLLGKEITTLVDRELTPGRHESNWETRGIESGTYFYQLRAGEFTATKKLILTK